MNEIKDFIANGGFMMYPILFVSVIALAIIIERFIRLYFIRRPSKRQMEDLRGTIITKNAGDLCRGASEVRHPAGRIITRVFALGWYEGNDLDRKLSMEGSLEERHLSRFLGGLGIIGSTAPLMGLLGTVLGMIKAFMRIYEMAGDVNPTQLAGGIWEALITTAAGLMVAIPALIAYHIFAARTDAVMFETRMMLEELFGGSLRSPSFTGAREAVTSTLEPDYGI